MAKLDALNQKIEDLLERKKKLEHKEALTLYTTLKKNLGKDFSPELILAILQETWLDADADQKGVWRDAARKFCPAKSSKKSSQV